MPIRGPEEAVNQNCMNVLAVDTSSEKGSVAITGDGEVLGEVRLVSSIQHSERLFRSIDFLFAHVDITIEDIDLFAAARGPGSFTGLRVGLAAVEGFAFANDKPSVGVSTLAAMAWQVGEPNTPLAPMLDARRCEFYCALFERQGEELVELRQPVVLKAAEWFACLPESRVLFCGNAVSDALPSDRPREWEVVSIDPYLSATIARMATTSNREALEPLYIKTFGAEAKKNEGGPR